MLDFIGITLLIVFFIRGYMKGIVVALLSVLSIVFGIIFSLKLSSLLANYLLDKGWVNSSWALVVSYAILFTCVLIAVRLLGNAIKSSLRLVMLGWIDGIAGGLLYALAAAICWSSVLWMGDQVHLINPEAKTASRTYAYFIDLAPWAFEKAGALLPFAKNLFAEMGHYFDKIDINK